MTNTFKSFLEQHLEKNPKFRERWQRGGPMRDFRAAILRERLAQKMTQKDLAKKANVSIRTVLSIELGNGDLKLRLEQIVRVLDALGYSLAVRRKKVAEKEKSYSREKKEGEYKDLPDSDFIG